MAQLGARLTGGQEAVSSSLATRTKNTCREAASVFLIARLEQSDGEAGKNLPGEGFLARVRAGALQAPGQVSPLGPRKSLMYQRFCDT